MSLLFKYEQSPIKIGRWKEEFIENSSAAFDSPKRDDPAIEKQKDRYLQKIGDLEIMQRIDKEHTLHPAKGVV